MNSEKETSMHDEIEDRVRKSFPLLEDLTTNYFGINYSSLTDEEQRFKKRKEWIYSRGKDEAEIMDWLRRSDPNLFLTDKDREKIRTSIKGDARAKQLAEHNHLITHYESHELRNDVAEEIAGKLGYTKEEVRAELDPFIEKYEISKLNLGLVNCKASDKDNLQELFRVNRTFLESHPKIAERLLVAFYLPKLEPSKTPAKAREKLQSVKDEIAEAGGFYPKTEHTKYSCFGLEAMKHFNMYIDHWENLVNQSKTEKKPKFHQANSIYDVVENGTDALMMAYGTSGGKTFSAVGILGTLQKERMTPLKTVVFARNQTMGSVWSQSDLEEYFKMVGIDEEFLAKHHLTKDKFIPRVRLINKAKDLESLPKNGNPELIVINYEKIGMTKDFEHNRYINFLKEYVRKCDLVAFDETQNQKNIESNRSRGINIIMENVKEEAKVLMLSATPVMNKLKDFGKILYLLGRNKEFYANGKPVKYTFDGKIIEEEDAANTLQCTTNRFEKYKSQPFIYQVDPDAIKDVCLKRQMVSFSRDRIAELYGLPELIGINKPEHVGMDNKSIDDYLDIWQELGDFGSKLVDLRRILIKSKMAAVDEKIRQIKKKEGDDAQIVIFTHLKNDSKGDIKLLNSLEKICKKYYDEDRVEIIHGKTELEHRIEYAKEFEKCNLDALVCTAQTMNEGISLASEKKRVHLIFAEPPITPGDFEQIVGRVYRSGTTQPVTVHNLISKSEELEKRMQQLYDEMQNDDDIMFPDGWKPSTIDEDRLDMRIKKQLIYENVIKKGINLKSAIDEFQKNPDSPDSYKSMPRKSPSSIFIQAAKAKGVSYEKGFLKTKDFQEYMKDDEAFMHSTNYDINFFTSELIKALDKEAKFVIADCGSANARLQRVMPDRKIISIDGCLGLLQDGMKKTDGCDSVNANLRNLPVKDKCLDLINCSRAIHLNDQRKREIEQIVLEQNRALKKGGYVLLSALQDKKTNGETLEQLKLMYQTLGFEILKAETLSGYDDKGKSKDEMDHYMIARKVRSVKKLPAKNKFEDLYRAFEVKGKRMTGGTTEWNMCIPQRSSKNRKNRTKFKLGEDEISELVRRWVR